MVYTALSAEFSYADDSTRTVTIEPFLNNSSSVTNFKSKVKTFNSAVPQNFASTFLSNEGASCTGIVSASITTTEKTVIFAKSAEYASKAMESGDDNGNG